MYLNCFHNRFVHQDSRSSSYEYGATSKTVLIAKTKHHSMRRMEACMYSSTNSEARHLEGGEWSASQPDRLFPREKKLCPHWVGGWLGPRIGLDVMSLHLVELLLPSGVEVWQRACHISGRYGEDKNPTLLGLEPRLSSLGCSHYWLCST
jgi:hypothetical protein